MIAFGAAVLLLGVAAGSSPAATSPFTRTDLGTLGGASSSAVVVNDVGQVVGYSATVSGDSHAFSSTKATGMIDLGTLGGSTSGASDVNDVGQVVGTSTTPAGNQHAFSWTAATGMTDLGTLGGDFSLARAVSNSGQVAYQHDGVRRVRRVLVDACRRDGRSRFAWWRRQRYLVGWSAPGLVDI